MEVGTGVDDLCRTVVPQEEPRGAWVRVSIDSPQDLSAVVYRERGGGVAGGDAQVPHDAVLPNERARLPVSTIGLADDDTVGIDVQRHAPAAVGRRRRTGARE